MDHQASVLNKLFTSWVILHAYLSSAIFFFFEINFFQEFFQEKDQTAKPFDPDQARHFVGPDLGPNCL